MPRFELKESNRHLTSYAGLALIGQCYEAAQVDKLDFRLHTSQGMKTSDLVTNPPGADLHPKCPKGPGGERLCLFGFRYLRAGQ